MHRIHVLAPELISQIAAGEVIERPASALKELVENSIDAGATRITVEVSGGGLDGLRVVDDGCGMNAEDAALAFERHATSKISDLEDLMRLGTLGFRGEALASLASVAQVELRTRARGERVGTRVLMRAGQQLECVPEACPEGCSLTIRGLFDPVPARKKYMKSEATEYGHCFDTLVQMALAYPEIGFSLLKDGELVFELPVQQSLLERVRTLFGGDTSEALIPLSFQQSNLLISGFVGKPELSRKSRKYQFLFVNGHAVDNRLVGRAVQDAFRSLLMNEQFPWWILDLHLDPAFVDVNVHPRKLEVRFVNTQEVYRAVFGAVSHALEKAFLSPTLGQSVVTLPQQDLSSFQPNTPVAHQPVLSAPTLNFSPVGVSVQEEVSPLGVRLETPLFEIKGLRLRPLAQVARRYIVAEGEEGLILIDQHAAHERVRYERLLAAANAQSPLKQPLLTPLQLDLGIEGQSLLRGHGELFAQLGYELEEFGGSTILIRAVPHGLRNPERLFKEVMADLVEDLKSHRLKDVREALLKSTACRGAIMFGDALTMLEMETLLADMAVTPNCTHCPHGRPSMITWTHDKLEELFKRKNF